jgi:uncharacterized membrane protein YkvA (DUF1232 family)
MVITRDEETVSRRLLAEAREGAGEHSLRRGCGCRLFNCAFDSRTPLRVKGTLLAALVYFIMPADIIPDFFLGSASPTI